MSCSGTPFYFWNQVTQRCARVYKGVGVADNCSMDPSLIIGLVVALVLLVINWKWLKGRMQRGELTV